MDCDLKDPRIIVGEHGGIATAHVSGKQCLVYDDGWTFHPLYGQITFQYIHDITDAVMPPDYTAMSYLIRQFWDTIPRLFPFRYNVQYTRTDGTATEYFTVGALGPHPAGHNITFYWRKGGDGRWCLQTYLNLILPFGLLTATNLRNPLRWEPVAWRINKNPKFTAWSFDTYYLAKGWRDGNVDMPLRDQSKALIFGETYEGSPLHTDVVGSTGNFDIFIEDGFKKIYNFDLTPNPTLSNPPDYLEGHNQVAENWGRPFDGIHIKWKMKST